MAGAADDAWSQAPARLHVLVARQCGAQALPTTAGFVLREGLQLRMTRGRVYRIRATSEAEECTPTAERDPAPVADSAMEDSGAEGGAPVDQGQAGLEPALETVRCVTSRRHGPIRLSPLPMSISRYARRLGRVRGSEFGAAGDHNSSWAWNPRGGERVMNHRNPSKQRAAPATNVVRTAPLFLLPSTISHATLPTSS